jgi:hypothetical protein
MWLGGGIADRLLDSRPAPVHAQTLRGGAVVP